MAGHNKWSKIKRGKAITDAKRGNAFSKLSKEITLAAKHGGGSPDSNARLRSAILAARAANVPNDNIDRAIKKGTGELGGAQIEEILYEAYAPGGALGTIFADVWSAISTIESKRSTESSVLLEVAGLFAAEFGLDIFSSVRVALPPGATSLDPCSLSTASLAVKGLTARRIKGLYLSNN